MTNYYVTQDGIALDESINNVFRREFSPGDIAVKSNNEYISFVGFIYLENNVLISFPKNFLNLSELKRLPHETIKLRKYMSLLIKCVSKTMRNRSLGSSGLFEEFSSHYPFSDFKQIHHYYMNYGLFTSNTTVKKFGFDGRISWIDTLRRSQKLIINKNLLHHPFVVVKSTEQYVFVSLCMAYAINKTLLSFPNLVNGSPINLNTKSFNFSNSRLVVAKLRDIKKVTFKDAQIKLLSHLILFFEAMEKKGGAKKLTVRTFHVVWEDMVRDLIRTRFESINESGEIQWSKSRRLNNVDSKIIYPDVREGEGFAVQPDYYFIKDNNRYILDAKYYTSLDRLDYKQVAYYFLLKDFTGGNDNNKLITYSALILPSTNKDLSEIHLQLKPEYNLNETNFVVYAFHLDTISVMKQYVNMP